MLKGVPGATKSFVYDHQIPIEVRRDGADDMKITSERQSRRPPASLRPQQGGVINQTNPHIQFDSNCYVDARPVVTMLYVVAHSATTQSVVPVTATEVDLG